MLALPSGEISSAEMIVDIESGLSERAARFANDMNRAPGLAILSAYVDHKPSRWYMNLKREVGSQLGFEVDSYGYDNAQELADGIDALNDDSRYDGLVVQLPLQDHEGAETSRILDAVHPRKDVDGLSFFTHFTPATAMAAKWWIDGVFKEVGSQYYLGHVMAIRGQGTLAGKPLGKLLEKAGAVHLRTFDKHSPHDEIVRGVNDALVVVTAVGVKDELLTPDFFPRDTGYKVLVDIGTTEQGGVQKGDVSPELRALALERDWAITPEKGGVGPLTVRALLSNVMRAAERARDARTPGQVYADMQLAEERRFAAEARAQVDASAAPAYGMTHDGIRYPLHMELPVDGLFTDGMHPCSLDGDAADYMATATPNPEST